MLATLQELDVDLKKTDFFITHLHVDHLGLLATLITNTSKAYFSRKEADFRKNPRRWQDSYEFFLLNGFPEDELKKALVRHPGKRFGLERQIDFCLVDDGDQIVIGHFDFRCIETPGHSPGHMCLYEPNKKILVSGDHILFDITPNITYWTSMNNSLKEYMASLEKVYNLDVELILPGHRRIWINHRQRISELLEHHKDRANEIIDVLKDGPKTASEVAPHVTWDVNYSSWEHFPASQKWFAVGETIAHLYYLEEKGMINKERINDMILYCNRISPE
jgi:glyoxylase-like metal-dependent hydrolase (beta-lactamase superfamily II)